MAVADFRTIFYKSRKAAGKKPWAVVTPAALSPDAKRHISFFSSEAEAKQHTAELRRMSRTYGAAATTLPPGDAAAYAAALSALPDGISLATAAQLAAQLITEFGDLGTAIELARAGQLAKEQANSWPDVTIETALERMNELKSYQRPTSQASRRAKMGLFIRSNPLLCVNVPLHRLSRRDLIEAINHAAGKKPRTYNSVLIELKALLSWAVEQGLAPENPLAGAKKIPIKEQEIRPLSPLQMQALLAACRPATALERTAGANLPSGYARRREAQDTTLLAPYFALQAFAGLRPTEAARLTWDDVDLHEGIISIRQDTSKTGGIRHVPMNSTIKAWLALTPMARRRGHIVPQAGLKIRIQAVHGRAGFRGTWQADCLRHSFASYALKSGMNLADVQAAMGHASLNLLRARYLNLRGLTAAAAAAWWAIMPHSA